MKASSRVGPGKALLAVAEAPRIEPHTDFDNVSGMISLVSDSHSRLFGSSALYSLLASKWQNDSSPWTRMRRPLASVLCLAACKQTYDATLYCGLFLQPSAFYTAWFIELCP